MERPPVASKQNPVVKEHARDVMKQTKSAISESSPVRFIGILSVMYRTCASGMAATCTLGTGRGMGRCNLSSTAGGAPTVRTISVRTTAGARALQVTPLSAYSLPMTSANRGTCG